MKTHQVANTRRLRERHAKKGLKQVTVWIPATKAAELKAIARGMRDANNPV